MKATVSYFNHNGLTTTDEIEASSVRGLKNIAYKNATGSHTKVTLLCDEGYYQKEALDSFWGFCKGSKNWETKS